MRIVTSALVRVSKVVASGGLVAVALLLGSASVAEADVTFNVKGAWTCKSGNTSVPIAGARIELWREISYWPDDRVGSRILGSNGSFDFGVRAGGNFNLYVKVLLRDDAGVELTNWYSPSTWETETDTKGSHSGVVDLGTWEISRDGSGSPKCAVWQGAHNAYTDYKRVVGSNPATGDLRIDADFPCCGTPFTTRNVIRWPGGYDTRSNYSVSFHEFAHSFRHSLDGGNAHFLYDVGRFSYPQNHTPCQVTNEGFAFNEGWAEYWAKTPQTCGDGTNFTQEGNVASALTGLEKCTSRPSMVRVLREGPGVIHTYGEFRSRFFQTYGNKVCLLSPLNTGGQVLQPLSAQQTTADLNNQIAAQKKLIANLSRQMGSAKTRARKPGRCAAGGCQRAMEKLIEPSALNAQVQQAGLVLGRLRDGLAATRKAKFDPVALEKSTLVTKLAGDRDKFESANQAIVIKGLKKSLQEIKTEPGFRRGRSSDLFRTLDRRLDTLTAIRKRGRDTPASLESLYAPPSAPVDAVKKVRKGR